MSRLRRGPPFHAAMEQVNSIQQIQVHLGGAVVTAHRRVQIMVIRRAQVRTTSGGYPL